MTRERAGDASLSLTIEDRAALGAAYMPFLERGGLFLPTERSCDLGDEVLVVLELADEAEPIRFRGKVVWVTPQAAGGGRRAGIGVQFGARDAAVAARIDALLADVPAVAPSHTM